MCCANKNFLTSLILWLITLLGLSPVAGEWAATFEDWTGISLTNRQATVIAYQEEGETAFYAHIFGPAAWDDVLLSPAVVTFHRTKSEKELAYALCRQLAAEGYVAITFEAPALESDAATVAYTTSADSAMRWMHENLEALGIAPSEIAVWAQGTSDSLSARLAVHAVRAIEEDTPDPRACPSALILLFSPVLPGWEGVSESADMVETTLWLDNVQPSLPTTVVLLSDEAPSQLALYAEGLLGQMSERSSPCEIVRYPGEPWESPTDRGLRREMDAIVSAMHEALQAYGFGHREEE